MLESVDNLVADVSFGELVFDVSKCFFNAVYRLLNINLVGIVILQHIMKEIVRKLQT